MMTKYDPVFINSIFVLVIVEVLALIYGSIGLASIAVVAMFTIMVMWKVIAITDRRERRRNASRRTQARR